MTLIKASELNPNLKYYKLLNESECEDDICYKTGLNQEKVLSESCKKGSLYFISELELINIISFLFFDIKWIREVSFETIPDEPIYIEEDMNVSLQIYKTRKFFLKERKPVSIATLWTFINPELLNKLVGPNNLIYIPDNFKTPEMCLQAVKNYKSVLQYVPEELKTPELCMIAINEDSMSLEYVPEKLKTPELCLHAVQKNGIALKYVPEELKTLELCMVAIKESSWCFGYIPEELKTPENYPILSTIILPNSDHTQFRCF